MIGRYGTSSGSRLGLGTWLGLGGVSRSLLEIWSGGVVEFPAMLGTRPQGARGKNRRSGGMMPDSEHRSFRADQAEEGTI
jgi:hypothetical protein